VPLLTKKDVSSRRACTLSDAADQRSSGGNLETGSDAVDMRPSEMRSLRHRYTKKRYTVRFELIAIAGKHGTQHDRSALKRRLDIRMSRPVLACSSTRATVAALIRFKARANSFSGTHGCAAATLRSQPRAVSHRTLWRRRTACGACAPHRPYA